MQQYSEELKAALVKKMLPPQNVPVGQLARETGIPKDTLYTWRAKDLSKNNLYKFQVIGRMV